MLPDAIPPHNSAELPALAGDGNHTVVPSVPPRDASMASLEFALGIPISTDSHFSTSFVGQQSGTRHAPRLLRVTTMQLTLAPSGGSSACAVIRPRDGLWH
jgi:hypothetical protein